MYLLLAGIIYYWCFKIFQARPNTFVFNPENMRVSRIPSSIPYARPRCWVTFIFPVTTNNVIQPTVVWTRHDMNGKYKGEVNEQKNASSGVNELLLLKRIRLENYLKLWKQRCTVNVRKTVTINILSTI